MHVQIKKAQRTTDEIIPKTLTSRHSEIQSTEIKCTKSLEAAERKVSKAEEHPEDYEQIFEQT